MAWERGARSTRRESGAEFLNWARGHPDTTKPLWSMRIRVERRQPEANFAALGFAPNRWIDAEGLQLKGFVCEWEP